MKIYSKHDLPFIDDETINKYNSIVIGHDEAKNILKNIIDKIDTINSKKSNVPSTILAMLFIGGSIYSLIISGSLLVPFIFFIVFLAIIGNTRDNSGDPYEKGNHGVEYKEARRIESELQFKLWGYHDIFTKARIEQVKKDKIEEQHIIVKEQNEARKHAQYWLKLSGWQFEKEVARVFRKNGYEAIVTRGSGDGGVDINLIKNNERIIVQCKLLKNIAGPSIVRDLYGTLSHEKADKAFIVSATGFSNSVMNFIKDKPITLFTLKDIIEMDM